MTTLPGTGCRYRFTPSDWKFIVESLDDSARGRAGLASLCRDPDSVQQILDHPKLFEAVVMSRAAVAVSPVLFFSVVVRHTLKRIGVEEPEVADYVAIACAEFKMPAPGLATQPLAEIPSLYSADYIDALESARGPERFFIHMQCANQFMVLTCLYPSFLQHRAERRGAPGVGFYEGVVMSHLQAASHHVLADEFALHDVLERLSEAFPPVRRAMNYTAREYLSLGA
ncbi:MAG: hypothetical protein JWO89_3119 [Verrucomicrobiaceae bacterium]|nr:hypothetical protein [Verrucomicrobiaceae bacterium]MDB6119572.1 hypothetical protein [Verrucomicrobiaceae bacterium]